MVQHLDWVRLQGAHQHVDHVQELLREVKQALKDAREQAQLAAAEAQELRGQLAASQQSAAQQQQRLQADRAAVQARGPRIQLVLLRLLLLQMA